MQRVQGEVFGDDGVDGLIPGAEREMPPVPAMEPEGDRDEPAQGKQLPPLDYPRACTIQLPAGGGRGVRRPLLSHRITNSRAHHQNPLIPTLPRRLVRSVASPEYLSLDYLSLARC
jgi:hypothetical protein